MPPLVQEKYERRFLFVRNKEEETMYLYNSLSHKKELFTPRDPEHVKMYTCGPTVYHYAHIGNLRTYIMEDVLEKSLRYMGYGVKRVMNITDVGHLSSDADTGEDKMLKGAAREHKTVMEVAKFLCRLRQAEHQAPGCGRACHQLHCRVYPHGADPA